MSAGLHIERLRVAYGTTTAITRADLEVPAASLTAVLGPSGCGKSTLLHAVAGLVRPQSGQVRLGGEDLLGVRAEKRPVSLMFQKPLLFPHLTVADNIAFGLRMQRRPKAEVASATVEMLERVGLEGFGERAVTELSGGQEQRVALARALVTRPEVLLLDEPLSALDAGLRQQMRDLIRELHDEHGLTTILVTHDQSEALDLADRLAVMLDGRLAGADATAQVYSRPPTLAAARFLGNHTELPPSTADGGRLIRPGELALVNPGDGDLDVTITAVRFAGSHLRVDCVTDADHAITVHAPLEQRPVAGDRRGLQIPTGEVLTYPDPS